MSKTSSAVPASSTPPNEPRRNVLTAIAAGVVGAIVTIVPVIPGVGFLLDPLLRKKKSGADSKADGFVKVTTLEALPSDGSPRSFPVQMDIQDAWNKFPNRQVGSVFLSRNQDGSLKCFSCVCPHLGCTINYADQAKTFLCPCHASSFSLDGERNNQIPPRSMDPLEAEIRGQNEIFVKFQTFRAGTSERQVVS